MKDFGNLTSAQRLDRSKKIDEFVRKKIIEVSGIDNVRGIQLSNIIRRVANLFDAIVNQHIDEEGVTGPRMGILIRLYGSEILHESGGVTPTMLSHMQNVTKNTISSLVKGLEDQGLIRRENDPIDRRIYRLYLTDAGREYIVKIAPKQINFLNSLVSEMAPEEIDQLIELLTKLQNSLLSHADFKRFPRPGPFHHGSPPHFQVEVDDLAKE